MSGTLPPELPAPQSGGRGGIAVGLVWLVPLIALVVALYIGWQAVSQRGPLIVITFPNAEGITANSTVLRYRDVNVGLVEDVTFSDDLTSVDVHVRIDKDMAPFIDTQSEFWIVRPQVTARGITGLSTVLSGVYLEGSWDATPGTPATEFEGLPAAPLVTRGEDGLEITLRSEEGGRLQAGAPIVYRGIAVGSIDQPRLSEDGSAVLADAFIKAPHDDLITSDTRFWSASGFSINLGAGGLSLSVASLAALLEGGVAFETFSSDGIPVQGDALFEVYTSETAARENSLPTDAVGQIPFTAVFDGSISGLSAGAPVEYQGLRVGTVTGLGVVREGEGNDTRLLMRANLSLAPDRLGLPEGADREATDSFIAEAVQNGLRARLVSQGLLSTTLKIELLQLEDIEPATLDMAAEPAPAIPTAPAAVSDVAESARGVLTRIQNLPLESLFDNVNAVLASAEAVISSEDVRRAPAAIVGLIDQTRDLIASDALRSTIDGASASVEQVQLLLQRVNDSDAVPAILNAMERIDTIAASLQDSAAGLPQLIARINDVAENAAQMPLDALAESAAAVIEDARQLVGSAQFQALPAALSASLENLEAATVNVRQLTAEVADSGAVTSLLSALDRTGSVMASIDQTAAGIPQLVERIDGLVAEASNLPLNELATSADEVLQSANRLLASPETGELPANLNAALSELTTAVAGVNDITTRVTEGPALDNLMAALSRTDTIAQSIEQTSAGLPALLDDIRAVTAEAKDLPLTELVNSADRLVNSADALVSSPDTAQIPAALASALDELGAALAELREGGAVANTNAALASAASAADAVSAAAQGLPELTARLDGLIVSSEQVLTTYGERSQFNAQTLAALRDLRDAARAVTALARSIERNPNQLIMGR